MFNPICGIGPPRCTRNSSGRSSIGSARTGIYRERWQIELFFKALKQNLKIKSFVGVSENALRIQIWTALIAMLILKWLHHLSKAGWSLSVLATMLRLNLFTYRDLRDWLDDPNEYAARRSIARTVGIPARLIWTGAWPRYGQPQP